MGITNGNGAGVGFLSRLKHWWMETDDREDRTREAAWATAPPRRSSASPKGAPARPARPTKPEWDRLAAEAAEVDLVALLERRGYHPVWKRKDGQKATFHVPWRPDRHPSLGVYKRGAVWYWTDHARNETGTPIQALQRLDGMTRVEAILALTGHAAGRAQERRPAGDPVADGARQGAGEAGPGERADPARREKIAQARALYTQACQAMTPAQQEAIAAYWRRHGITAPPDIGAVLLELPAGAGPRLYLGVPVPTPEKVWGLECRLVDRGPDDQRWRARTIGPKALWVQWRDPRRVLVTESILDALAARQLWPEAEWSLVALNGVGQVTHLPQLVQQAARKERPIREIRLALDADPAGADATRQAQRLLEPLGVDISIEDLHAVAGVKDFAQLLRSLTPG